MKQKRTKNKKHIKRTQRKASIRKICCTNISFCIIFVVGLCAYIVMIAGATTQGFRLNELERTRAQTHDDIARAEHTVREVTSVEYITNKAYELGMVEADRVVYMQTKKRGVALKE